MSVARSGDTVQPLGPRAHAELRWVRAPGGMSGLCAGLMVLDGDSAVLAPSRCGERRLRRDELCVGQWDRPHATSADRLCCVSCAVSAEAVGKAAIIWSVHNWLSSGAAVRFIETNYPRYSPSRREEIIQLTFDKALRTIDSGKPPEAVVPWCESVIRNQCASIYRSPTRRVEPVEVPLADEFDVGAELEIPGEHLTPADVREALIGRAMEAWQRSASLTLLATECDSAQPGDRCPQPTQGATGQSRSEWAALWYAGKREAFVEDATVGADAVRQRRSRLAKEIRVLLRSVFDALKRAIDG